MCLTYLVLQALCVVALAISGILLGTAGKTKEKLNTAGWILLVLGGVGYIGLVVPANRCVEQTATDAVFRALSRWVMVAPRAVEDQREVKPSGQIRIATPSDSATVPFRAVVTGDVSDPNSEVWVVVHPAGLSSYWVQPRITVRQDGRWSVMTYIGREATDSGRVFEMLAVANPLETIEPGQILSAWPRAQQSSGVIEIVRY